MQTMFEQFSLNRTRQGGAEKLGSIRTPLAQHASIKKMLLLMLE